MKPFFTLAALLAVQLFLSSAGAAGLSRNENFMVMAPTQELADRVLKAAEQFRHDVAVQWLGAPLPPSVGPAIVHVELSETRDDAFTWAKNGPDRKYHSVYLTTSLDQAVGSTLKHEITHVVLATRFPDRLPVWLEEGCAGYADDASRLKTRRAILDWFARTGNWPNLAQVLNAKKLSAADRSSYAIACSVTHFLMDRGSRQHLIAFGELVQEQGPEAALKSSYGFASIEELGEEWQTWYSGPRSVALNSQQKTR